MKTTVNSRDHWIDKTQTGWIMVEMVLCLALLAVVVHLAQRQVESQWQALQVAKQQRQYAENRHKQTQMVSLTGSDRWWDEKATSQTAYPRCLLCSGEALAKWFEATQSAGSNLLDK